MPCQGTLKLKEVKKDLEEIFKEEMGGIQRVPAMMFFDQEKTLDDVNLGKTKRVFVLDAYYDNLAIIIIIELLLMLFECMPAHS